MSDDKAEAPNGADGANGTPSKSHAPQSKSGWDGKLRVNKQAVLANPEALSDPEYSDEDAPPVDQIEADEGMQILRATVETMTEQSRSVGRRRPGHGGK